jgi:hypothetical protein
MPVSSILIVSVLIISVADVLLRVLLLAMVALAGFLWLLHGDAVRSPGCGGPSFASPRQARAAGAPGSRKAKPQ